MTMVTAILTHLPADDVHERLSFTRRLAPEARFVIVHTGTGREFARIEGVEKVQIDDPTLRGPVQYLQSLTTTLEALWTDVIEPDPQVDSLYLIEYDHLILRADFEDRLARLAAQTGADLMGKNCADRTATNDEHYIRFRRDRTLLDHLARLSVRDDPTRLYGCLGDGIWFSRRAVQAYVEVDEHPPCYCETYVPTVLFHLGMEVVDIDAHSDLYHGVRWTPVFDNREALDRCRAGAVFLHPVKDLRTLRILEREALPAGEPV